MNASFRDESRNRCGKISETNGADIWSHELFSGLSPEQTGERTLPVIEHQVEDPAIIVEQGEAGRGLFLVSSGSVALTRKLASGQQQSLESVGAGGFFGETAFFTGADQPQPASARAVGLPAVIWEIAPGGLDSLLEACPEFRLRLSAEMADRFLCWNRRLNEELEDSRRLCALGLSLGELMHDLKTPLASILQTAYYLSRCAKPELTRLGKALDTSAHRMTQLTQEILDFSGDKVRLKLEPFRVGALLDRLNEELTGHPGMRHLEITRSIASDSILQVDAGKLLRVFVNLAVNAIEAMSPGDTLAIVVTETEDDVIFEFRDTGKGIPKEVLGRVFEPFVTSGKTHGSGLGMAIAKRFIDAHQGRIWIESRLGIGTSVFTLLPRRRGPTGEAVRRHKEAQTTVRPGKSRAV